MARATLASLIAKTRLMIDDPAGAGAIFTDDQIQDALDNRRMEARYFPLDEIETITSGGNNTVYLTFQAQAGNWEGGVELVNSSYVALTPATSDLTVGRWTFSTEPKMPVMLTGFTHDLYGAAADLLAQRATAESDSFDVSADGLTLARSQKAAMYRQRADEYLAKARTRSVPLIRRDEW
jgi:hypothetical protein